MPRLIAPSLLAADFNNLGRALEMVNRSPADWVHCDVMDGVFVPNISFGLPVVEHVARIATKPLDVHLMIVEPERYIERFHAAGASILTVHYEACAHLHRALTTIRGLGMRSGVSLKPHTPVELLDDMLPLIDVVLVMTVNPGFGGQQLIEGSYDRVRRLRATIDSRGLSTLIEVDGGVDLTNYQQLFQAGVDVLVSGSAIFGASDPEAVIGRMKQG